MTAAEWIVVGVAVATLALMFGTRLRPDLVAVMAALALAVTGVIPEGAVLQGLSSTVVVTLIGLFILAEGLDNTGVTRHLAARLTAVGGGSEQRLLATLMGVAAVLALGMSNVAVGALLLPSILRVARSSGVPAARLLLPVSFATLLGGMATIFTSANIIVSDILVKRGEAALGMADFARSGGVVAAAGFAYMLLVGRRWLPSGAAADLDPGGDLFGLYRLEERFWEVEVGPGSTLADRTVEAVGFGHTFGLAVLAIRRHGRTLLVPGPGIMIVPGDRVVVLGRLDRLRALVGDGVELKSGASPEELQEELELTEIVVAPRSRAAGRTLAELGLRTRFGVTALALWRGGRIVRTDVGRTPLQTGDGLLVVNMPERLAALARGGAFLVTGSKVDAPERPERAVLAVTLFAAVLGVALAGLLPTAEAILAGALAMVLSGCLSMEQAYRAVEWHVIFLVAGLLPLGFAMTESGLAERVGTALAAVAATHSGVVAVALMFALTVAVTQVIGGQVAALLVAPIALAVAAAAGVVPQAMAVAVAIGASTAFLTPMAHPVNALMTGTGGYRPRDFARVGAGLTVVTFIALLASLWLFWGLG